MAVVEYLVVLDAVGTLIRPRHPVAETYCELAKRFSLDLDPEQISVRFRLARQRFFETEHDLATAHCPSSQVIEENLWREIVSAVFHELADSEALFQQLWDYYASPSNWTLYPDVTSALQSLRSLPCQVVIGSNFDERLPAICQHHDALRSIPAFISSSVGFRKPDRRFYVAIESQQRKSAEQIMMVGDHPINDVAAPIQLGWNAWLLDRDADRETTEIISTLNSLVSRVRQLV